VCPRQDLKEGVHFTANAGGDLRPYVARSTPAVIGSTAGPALRGAARHESPQAALGELIALAGELVRAASWVRAGLAFGSTTASTLPLGSMNQAAHE
jgi:hypothetical protein